MYPKAQVTRGCFCNAVSRCADKEQSLQAQPHDALYLLPLHFISAGTFASHLVSFYHTAECAGCSKEKDLTKITNHCLPVPAFSMASQQGKLHNSVEQNLLIFSLVYKQYAIYDLPRALHSSVVQNQHMDQSTSHDSTSQMSLLLTVLPNHQQLNTLG